MIVSHHFLRRTARRKRDQLERELRAQTPHSRYGYVISKGARGPRGRWRVEKVRIRK